MFATEYYCLVAGLKEYSLDADTKGFDAKAIVGEILDGVSASDAAQVRLLYGYYDCENIASLRAGRSAHNPLGNFTREELRNFELLLGVTGVGAKAALAILSSTTPDRFALAIFSQDEKALTAAPGVGKKLAQRILLELKDKLGGAAPAEGGISLPAGDVPAASGSALALAQAALAELGYRPQEITAALRSFDPEGMKTEEIVRQCLRAMVMR